MHSDEKEVKSSQNLKGRFWRNVEDLREPTVRGTRIHHRLKGSIPYPLLDSKNNCYDGSPCAVSFMLPACHVIVSTVDHKAVDNVCCTDSSCAVSTVLSHG